MLQNLRRKKKMAEGYSSSDAAGPEKQRKLKSAQLTQGNIVVQHSINPSSASYGSRITYCYNKKANICMAHSFCYLVTHLLMLRLASLHCRVCIALGTEQKHLEQQPGV